MLWASKYGTLDSTAGSGYELQVIAAVVIGGVAIFGGSGSVIGAALGALLLSTILAALYVVGVSPFWTQAIEGDADPRRDLDRPPDLAPAHGVVAQKEAP